MTSQQTETVAARPIREAFTYDGFTFRLLKRAGDVALFEKRKPTHSRETFEVVIIQHRPAAIFQGRECPAREVMPPSESWGTLGWTCIELEDAERKFNALAESRQEGHSQPTCIPASAFSPAGSVNTPPSQPNAPEKQNTLARRT